MNRFFYLAAAFSLLPAAAAADNWPSWRGPTANGVATPTADPPLKWDAKTNIKWKAPLPGRGSATPVVWGDQIFVVTATKTDRIATAAERPKVNPKFQAKTKPPANFYRFEVLGFDRETGRENWRKTLAEAVPHEGHHETHSYAGGSPATDGERLYVSFGSFGIFALDFRGNVLWTKDFGRINSRLGWGEAVTPVVHKGTLLLNFDQEGDGDSRLYALDATTGATKWQAKRDERSTWSVPFVAQSNGVTLVIMNGSNRIRAYDLKDGTVVWQVGGMVSNPIPTPVVHDGHAYVVSGYRGTAAVSIPLTSKGDLGTTGPVAWRYNKGTPYVPSPLLYDGRLYFTQSNVQLLTILDAKSGKPLVEAERLPGVGEFYASPMAAAGRIYMVDRKGTTLVLKAGDGVEVLATNTLNDPIDASPVACGKTLFLRSEKALYAIEAK
jgi:outer membrane protein assembly factor BamB